MKRGKRNEWLNWANLTMTVAALVVSAVALYLVLK